jgi:TonB family protein
LPLNPRLLCCLRFAERGRHDWSMVETTARLVLLCAGALPCRAESEAASQWEKEIAARLQLHQNFPLEACGKGGEAKVALRIDRTGKLISSDIVSGAGLPAFDKAALEIVKNAQPFTPAPPEFADDDLKFVLVMVFVKSISYEGAHREEQLRSVINGEDKVRSAISGVCRGC